MNRRKFEQSSKFNPNQFISVVLRNISYVKMRLYT